MLCIWFLCVSVCISWALLNYFVGEERILNLSFFSIFCPFLGGGNFSTVMIDRYETLSELFFQIENASLLCDL